MKRKIFFLMVICLSLLTGGFSTNAEFIYSGANEPTELFEIIANTFCTKMYKSSVPSSYKEVEGIVEKIAAGMPLSTAESEALTVIHPIGVSLLVGLELKGFDEDQLPTIEVLQKIANTISDYELEQLPSTECGLFMAQLEGLCDLLALDILYAETGSASSSFPYIAIISREVQKDGIQAHPPMLIYNTIPENIAVNLPALSGFLVDGTRPSATPTAKLSTQSTQKPVSRTTYQQPKLTQPTATPATFFVFAPTTTATNVVTVIATASPAPTILMTTVQPTITPTIAFTTPTATIQATQTPSPTNSPTPTATPTMATATAYPTPTPSPIPQSNTEFSVPNHVLPHFPDKALLMDFITYDETSLRQYIAANAPEALETLMLHCEEEKLYRVD